jgi:hypothetical protein
MLRTVSPANQTTSSKRLALRRDSRGRNHRTLPHDMSCGRSDFDHPIYGIAAPLTSGHCWVRATPLDAKHLFLISPEFGINFILISILIGAPRRPGGGTEMKWIFARLFFAAAAAFAAVPSIGWAKTVRECEAEWKANKAAIQASGQTKKDFVAACRAETAPAPGTTMTTPPAAPKPGAPVALPEPSRVPASRVAPTKSGEFTTEAEVKAKCPSDTVVWCNTNSGVYHYAGTHNYGHTKSGAYICKADTAAAGCRPAKNERHFRKAVFCRRRGLCRRSLYRMGEDGQRVRG